MAVIIGIDPHKQSHTAVAIDERELTLDELRVRASLAQADRLMSWASEFKERIWAIEGANGLGALLAQQLLSRGETVLDVAPKLASRVRLLETGDINKNDPNDARSVAIAALRARNLQPVRRDDHPAVLKVWAKRNVDLGHLRNKVACRLHSVLCDLVPGGISREIRAAHARSLLEDVTPTNVTEAARCELAADLLEDFERLEDQLKASKRRIQRAVAASGTTLTELYGVGPVVACMVIGYTKDVRRFATADRFASYTGTAPIEVSSGERKVFRLSRRGNRQLNHAIHIAAITQLRNPSSEGRIYYEKKRAEGKTAREAIRSLKRRISDRLYRQLWKDAERQRTAEKKRAREGKQGAALKPARPALTLNAGSSEKPLPDPKPPYVGRRRSAQPARRSQRRSLARA